LTWTSSLCENSTSSFLFSSALTDVNGFRATYRHAIGRSGTHREAELRMIACSQRNPVLLADQSLAISFISTTDCGVENDRLRIRGGIQFSAGNWLRVHQTEGPRNSFMAKKPPNLIYGVDKGAAQPY
jgi:hypothetical protein